MANVACIIVMTRRVMDRRNMRIVKGAANLSMSFNFTSGSQREGQGIVVRAPTYPEEQLGVEENARFSED
jgi:hypothetical protein